MCCNEEEEEGESRAERQTRLALRRRVELAQSGVRVTEHTRRQRERQLVGAVFKKQNRAIISLNQGNLIKSNLKN